MRMTLVLLLAAFSRNAGSAAARTLWLRYGVLPEQHAMRNRAARLAMARAPSANARRNGGVT